MLKRFLISLVVLIQALSAWAGDYSELEKPTQAKPKVALVLSGGGARGFAHVGVIKVLEELGIQIDIVTGTSMGSMVGGGYASGYTAQQMQTIIQGVDWKTMFALRPEREALSWRNRKDDYQNLILSGVGLSKDGLRLPDSLLPAQNLGLFLNRITEHVAAVEDLSELAIPFGCVATDLSDGSAVYLQKQISLAQAMRASLSIPGAFAPMEFEGKWLVDGGLAQNLPVEMAREMGADIVIAVNVGTPVGKAEDVHNVFDVMGQVIGILTERNVTESKRKLTDRDILITPDLSGFSSADFSRSSEIIQIGEEAARQNREKLQKLASDIADYSRWNAQRVAHVSAASAVRVSEVRVEGLNHVNPKAVVVQSGIQAGDVVDVDDLSQASSRIWATGHFDTVPYRLEKDRDGMQSLVIAPQEKPWGFNTLRVGAKLGTNFVDDHAFQFVLSHTWSWLNSWGGEWRNEMRIGRDGAFSSSFYQPLGPASPFFVQPEITIENQQYEWYGTDDYPDAEIHNRIYETGLNLGYEFADQGMLRAGLGYVFIDSKPIKGVSLPQAEQSMSSPFARVELELDTLDSVAFPRSGYYLYAGATHLRERLTADTETTDYRLTFNLPIALTDNTTVLGTVKLGKSTIRGRYAMGGLFNLSGAPYGRYVGSELVLGRLIAYHRLGAGQSAGFPLYIGASAEVGRVKNSGLQDLRQSEDFDDWKRAGSIFMAADSLFGPIYFGIGKTEEDHAIYLYWGIPY